MQVKTNLDAAMKEHLQSLVGQELIYIIFYQLKPGMFYINSFPHKREPFGFSFGGQRLALVFKMHDLPLNSEDISPPTVPNKKPHRISRSGRKRPNRIRQETQFGVLSMESNHYETDNFIMGYMGAEFWNIDFYFETFIGKYPRQALPKKIRDFELYENDERGRRKIKNTYTLFTNVRKEVKKIKINGMKEYFENIDAINFENMRRPESMREISANFSYPIDIDVSMTVGIELQDNITMGIRGSGNHLSMQIRDKIETEEWNKKRNELYGEEIERHRKQGRTTILEREVPYLRFETK